jgi:resuscitation-promoting factor RpfB
MAISGIGLAYATAGGVLLWSGIKGETVAQTVGELARGKQPTGADTEAVTIASAPSSASSAGGGGGSFATPIGSGSSAAGMSALKQAANPYGWDTGAQWTKLVYVEMREAGFNPHARNPTSGALGLAQALGHGNANTAGTLGNEYGGYGLTDAQAKLANSGNAYWQAVWMVNYIKATYGTPEAAAAHEAADNWY